LPSLEAPLLYQMQFTTTEEHAELVEKAKALLSHSAAKLSLGELHLQAMRMLVEALEKKRFGAKRWANEAENEAESQARTKARASAAESSPPRCAARSTNAIRASALSSTTAARVAQRRT
jgi:hypothetical protein